MRPKRAAWPRISTTLRRQGHTLNEIAILVRASFQMRAFEDRFVTVGMPYRVIGGPRFYERQEIKDAIAYLDIVQNPSNDLKFERIVNVPKRALGDVAIQTLHRFARAEGCSLYRGRKADRADRGAEAAGAQAAGRAGGQLRALAQDAGRQPPHRGGRDGAGRIRLHGHVAERQDRRKRRPGWKT